MKKSKNFTEKGLKQATQGNVQDPASQKAPQNAGKTEISAADLKVQKEEGQKCKKDEKAVCQDGVPGPQRP